MTSQQRQPKEITVEFRLSQVQWMGIGGAIVTFLGMFAPLYDWLTIKITLISLGWPAAAIGVATAVAAATIIRRQGKWAFGAGLVALGVALYVLMRTEVSKASIEDRYPTTDSGGTLIDPLGNGLNSMTDAVLAPQWGWALLLLGIAAILFSSVALARTARKVPTTT
jgi:hypothetical protein